MKLNLANSRRGVTLIEVLAVIGVVVLLGMVFLATRTPYTPARRKADRIQCLNNLKHIDLAFKTWALDNNDKYPMQVSVTNGGTMEFVAGEVAFTHFQVMSNELTTTKFLVCPSDGAKTNATSFLGLGNNNVSYFVGVDANETRGDMLLGGDRNVTVGETKAKPGLTTLTANNAVGWTSEIHTNAGNILMSDGSLRQLSSKFLQKLIQQSVTTNRLAIP
jgi:type II secretory pathway pseudopilin PulG